MVISLYFIWKTIKRQFLASANGYTETVKILLDKGANIEAKDVSGTTAIIYGK